MDVNKQRASFYHHQPKGDPGDARPLRHREDLVGGAFSRAAEEKLFGGERSESSTLRNLRASRPGNVKAVTIKRTGRDSVHEKRATASDRARMAEQWRKASGPPKLGKPAAALPPSLSRSHRAPGLPAPQVSGCTLPVALAVLTGVLAAIVGSW